MFTPKLIWDIISILKPYLVSWLCNINTVFSVVSNAGTWGYSYLQYVEVMDYIKFQLTGDLLC